MDNALNGTAGQMANGCCHDPTRRLRTMTQLAATSSISVDSNENDTRLCQFFLFFFPFFFGFPLRNSIFFSSSPSVKHENSSIFVAHFFCCAFVLSDHFIRFDRSQNECTTFQKFCLFIFVAGNAIHSRNCCKNSSKSKI